MITVDDTNHGRVVVTGIDIPFGQLVALIVKLSLAAIPAAIILAICYGIATLVFVSFIASIRQPY